MSLKKQGFSPFATVEHRSMFLLRITNKVLDYGMQTLIATLESVKGYAYSEGKEAVWGVSA